MKQLVIILLVFVTACSGNIKNNEKAVARVYDKYLYPSDIQLIITDNISPSDSLTVVNDYINNWIRQELLINKANGNLDEAQKDFSRQLEDYKNSLIIYTYEKELVRQQLDTNVTDEEIERYYVQNKSDFELKDNIVKVIYIKVMRNTPLTQARNLMRSDKEGDRSKLQDFCHKYAVNYYLDDQNWLLFNDILKEIPIKTYNQEEYLKNNRFIEILDSEFVYLLNIKGFMIKETLSPLSFEKDKIRDIIVNKRKLKLIEDMRSDLYNNALKSGDFEIFNP